MRPHRIAVAGAGNMARTRGRAFIDTGRAEICAVAASRTETAAACAAELACDQATGDYRRLADAEPDALLIETPHAVQDEIALWALERDIDLLIGGCLASNLESGTRIIELAAARGLVVEAGYQRRYDAAWERIRDLVSSAELGRPVMAICMALWSPDPDVWYYDQALSGGMPLTHMSYCYLNAVRWILGQPLTVAATTNRIVATEPGKVNEESCATCIGFADGSFASATASYAGPEGMADAATRFVCSGGGMQVDGDEVLLFRGGETATESFADAVPPFRRQADAFLDAIESRQPARNPPSDALVDVQIAEAIATSARDRVTVALPR